MTVNIIGAPSLEDMKAVENAASLPGVTYIAIMDKKSMWEPETLEKIVEGFPMADCAFIDLFLILAECISNAAVHAKAEVLAFYARRRKKVVLLSFFQMPRMKRDVIAALDRAQKGSMTDYLTDVSGGLGFPILVRVAYRVTINADRTKLQLWFRV